MQRVSLSLIAKQVGYSKNTVSLALRGDPRVPASTAELIKKAAAEHGYRGNTLVSQVMAQMRTSSATTFKAKLALINAYRDADAFKTHATIPAYVEGCERRAQQLGYSFDHFWLHDPTMRAETWLRILDARSIKGLIIVGLMEQSQLPPALKPVWEKYPSIVTGVRTHDPALSYSCVDHYDLVRRAFSRARELGYQRPALVMKDRIDTLVDSRFSGAMLACQTALPADQRIPAFTNLDRARTNQTLFYEWLDQHRPDVLLSLYNIIFPWLEARSIRVPHDLGVIQLEWRQSHAEISGMNQHNDLVGEAAVDMLVGQILRNESGIPQSPRATLISASWVDGHTVRATPLANPAKTISAYIPG
jgi:LacI family transcriptional regulator